VLLIGFSVHRWFFAAEPGPIVQISGETMGTTYTVKLALESLETRARKELKAAIDARLQHINKLMSTYDPNSELSRFNNAPPNVPFAVSPETLTVFRAAQQISELSGGAFDITVGPVVEAWGFGPSPRTLEPDEEAKLEGLRNLVDYRNIKIDENSGTLLKKRAGIHCDLSAIAKGYGVDQVAEVLQAQGYTHFLVEIGGELRAMGTKLDGSNWRIAIEKPDTTPDARELYETVELTDLAMATSGDYRNFFSEGGKRYSHTIDPRTGRPIVHNLASVTVLYANTMLADGWATALNVLGPEAGYTLAVHQGLAAFFLVREKEGSFRSHPTPEFLKLTRHSEPNEASP